LAVEVKKLWPQCKLSWVVDCAAGQLLKLHSAIDELIVIEKRWLKRPLEWKSLRSELRQREFDLVLDPQGLTKSAGLSLMTGAITRVSHDYSHARELAPAMATLRVKKTHRHMVDVYRQLLSPWTKVEAGEGEFRMPKYDQAAVRAQQIVFNAGMRPGGFVAINPGAGWSTRQWPTGRFAQVARELSAEFGMQSLVFWAGDEERLMAKVIEENSRGAAVAAPSTSLQELTECIRLATTMLTGDTGPLHLASAVGTPCVSLHGVTWADESGPYGVGHRSVQSPVHPPRGKMLRSGENTAMKAIEVDDVFHACAEVLRGTETKQAKLA
jgi:ADP-heptose:LPS heptosyltransferase